MKIILVEHSHVLGGVERHVLQLLRGLNAAGHVACFAGPGDSWLGEQCRSQGIELMHLPMRGMFDPYSAWRLARFARRWRADLLHGHTQRGARYAGWSARRSERPAVATAHSTHSYRYFDGVQRLLCVSDAVRQALIAHGYPGERTRLAYPGFDDPATNAPPRAEARRRLGLDDRDVVLLMVARLIHDKGHDVAIEAVKRLARPDIKLLLAGDDGNACGEQLRRQIESSGLAAQVRFLGQRDDVGALLSAADIVLGPSRREALSLSLVEAAAMQVPVIASRIGGIPEAVAENGSGLLVPAEDSHALADAIATLADDPPRRAAMGGVGRALYLERFSTRAMLESVLAVYAEVLDARPSSAR